MTGLPKKIAYCAPGRETVTALLLAYQDVDFDEVRASAIMEGRTDAILVDNEAIEVVFAATADAFTDLGRQAGRAAEAVRAYMRDYVHEPPLTGNSFRMLNGC